MGRDDHQGLRKRHIDAQTPDGNQPPANGHTRRQLPREGHFVRSANLLAEAAPEHRHHAQRTSRRHWTTIPSNAAPDRPFGPALAAAASQRLPEPQKAGAAPSVSMLLRSRSGLSPLGVYHHQRASTASQRWKCAYASHSRPRSLHVREHRSDCDQASADENDCANGHAREDGCEEHRLPHAGGAHQAPATHRHPLRRAPQRQANTDSGEASTRRHPRS